MNQSNFLFVLNIDLLAIEFYFFKQQLKLHLFILLILFSQFNLAHKHLMKEKNHFIYQNHLEYMIEN